LKLDARSLASGKVLECDVCIIGAGPAGIGVALELAECGATVVVLESGGTDNDPQIQELNDGVTVGDSYAGLRATRNRAPGGTVHLWNTPVGGSAGAKYVPLDPWDLEPRADASLPGWPLDYATLERYYGRAQVRCGLGPFSYEAAEWESPGRSAWPLPSGSLLTSRIYQLGQARCFTADYVNALRTSSKVLLCDHATVVCLDKGSSDRITQAQARVTTTEAPLSVAATFFVLAAGAIENARLLLVSEDHAAATFAAGHRWVGQCFMEHPRDTALSLVPRSKDLIRGAGIYDAHTPRGGVTLCGRLAWTAQAAASLRLPNLSITLLPHTPPLGTIRRSLRRLGLVADRRGYGWSHDPDPSRFFDRFQLLINLEQRPRPENRIVLARERDALGVPRAELHWNWSDAEQADWERTRSLIAGEIESAGLGKVEHRGSGRPDPNAHHHAGTTRMANEPDWGVVDSDGRVHGTSNLYVTGASVFPTAGFANPTLTIVALAIRLGEHLRNLYSRIEVEAGTTPVS
jgi:choline dehydrogenase-like flavoprotein